MGVKNLLIYLAEKGAINKQIELSTIQISQDIGSSQQTISRKLVELEELELIERQPSTRGIKIKITEIGIQRLKKLHLKLTKVFDSKKSKITGKLESGLGEGGYYIGLPQYYKQFQTKLNISPFKGTLNLKINYLDLMDLIAELKPILIEGFEKQGRSFGPIKAYKVKVKGIDSALIIPERTSHDKDIIEIISPKNFREKFKLKDGNKIEVSL